MSVPENYATQFNNNVCYSPKYNKESSTPKTDESAKQNSVFSTYDNNKNANIELTDASATNFINQQQNIKETSDENIKSKINIKELFTEMVKSSFKAFDYNTSKPDCQSADCEVVRNLSSQASSINQSATEKYNQMVEEIQQQIQKEIEEYANDAKSLRSDYDEALNSYKINKENDGCWEKAANYISYAWASKNTYSKVSADLETFKNKLDQLDSAVQSGDYKTSQTLVSELKSMNIKQRVEDFNVSQDKGGEVVQIGVEAAATVGLAVATGGTSLAATVAIGVGTGLATETLDKVTAEKPMDSNDAKDIAVNGLVCGLPAGKILGGGAKLAGKTFIGKGIETAVKSSSETVVAKLTQKFGAETVKKAQTYIADYGATKAVEMLKESGYGYAESLVTELVSA